MPSLVISASTAAATSFCACLDLGALPRARADDIEGAPGQHAGDGIEVGGIDIAADPRRLEGDRPATAERIRYLRPMAEPGDAQLLDKFGQALRICPEMLVHVGPDRREKLRFVAFLRPADVLQPRSA